MKKVLFGQEARAKLLEGINLVSAAVAATIGPMGRNAILSRDTAPPVVTNDGVSIASYFNKVEDPWVNVGVQMIKEVSAKQNIPGDGTTTATIIASALVNQGVEQMDQGTNPQQLIKGIKQAAEATIEYIKKITTTIKTKEQYIQVATISVEDEATGKLIGEMMYEVGKDGAVTVETSKEIKLEKDIAQGMKFEQGFLVPYFITNPYRQEAVIEDTPVLVTDYIISVNDQLTKLADTLLQKDIKRLVIVCEDMKGEALVTAINNTLKGIFQFLVISLPGLDEWRARHGRDIAVGVGAKFISRDHVNYDDITLEDLGHAERVIAKADETVIVKGNGTSEEIINQIVVLKQELANAISDFDRDQTKERIARLSNGIGVIRIGAATDQELVYKKHKIEDALAATRAAILDGIVPGGGIVLLNMTVNSESSTTGEDIFYQAIKQPITKIIENAGGDPKAVLAKIMDNGNATYGWDAKTNKLVEMIGAGIIDPSRVVTKAIENAVSMATMLLSAESLIVDIPEKKELSLEEKVATGQMK